MSQRNVVSQVQEKRLRTGKRLVPSGLGARFHKEKAEKAREETERADEEEGNKITISFGQAACHTNEVRLEERAQRDSQSSQARSRR